MSISRTSTLGRLTSNPIPWLGGLLVLYLLLPLAGLVSRLAAGQATGFGAPGLGPAFVVSVVTASCTTALCALLGVPLAYALARNTNRLTGVVNVAVLLPLVMPPLMAGILLVSVIGPNTALGSLFGGRLTDSMAGIVLAQTFVAAPFTIVAARSAFRALDPALLDVAATQGLRSWQRFTQVALPGAATGIVAGLLLSWLRAFGEFGATVIVAYHPSSLPVFTYVQFGGYGLAQAMAPTVLAVSAALVVLVVGRARLPRRARRGRTVATPAPRTEPADTLTLRLQCDQGSFHLRVAHAATSHRLAVLGSSGAGKTTLLRCLAGLAGNGVGTVHLGESELGGLPPEDRGVGYVPQEPSLVPRRSLWRQVTLGRGTDAGLAAHWVDRLHLTGLEDRRPEQLSGGQRQRAALVRALSRDPGLLLLDEPFSALDVPLRRQLQQELRLLLRTGRFTSVIVTHDPEEAALLSDELLVMVGGRLLQAGPTNTVFAHPATPEVAELLGVTNLHRGRVVTPDAIESGRLLLRMPTVALPPIGSDVVWSVWPEDVEVSFDPADRLGHEAVVLDAVDLGRRVQLRLVTGSLELLVHLRRAGVPEAGTTCWLSVPEEHVHVWPMASGHCST